jgi:hypothetical protein
MVLSVSMRVGTDMTIQEKSLAVPDQRIAVFEVDSSLSNRFHFGPQERYSRFEPVEDEIVVERLLVRGD